MTSFSIWNSILQLSVHIHVKYYRKLSMVKMPFWMLTCDPVSEKCSTWIVKIILKLAKLLLPNTNIQMSKSNWKCIFTTLHQCEKPSKRYISTDHMWHVNTVFHFWSKISLNPIIGNTLNTWNYAQFLTWNSRVHRVQTNI